MKYVKPFSLYKRKTKSGETVYYYRLYKNGVRSTGKSTGCTNRAEATMWVIKNIFK